MCNFMLALVTRGQGIQSYLKPSCYLPLTCVTAKVRAVCTAGNYEYHPWFLPVNPFRTAVPFWGQSTQIPSRLPPKRNCSPKRVNTRSRRLSNNCYLVQGVHVHTDTYLVKCYLFSMVDKLLEAFRSVGRLRSGSRAVFPVLPILKF